MVNSLVKTLAFAHLVIKSTLLMIILKNLIVNTVDFKNRL